MSDNLQPPKGTQDRYGEDCYLVDRLFSVIRNQYKLHGTPELQTPVFEREEVLTGKYGEDEKLIFKLKKQGGLPYALRYDHTVPFARYIAKNNLSYFTRFCIGQVYRRDNPSAAQGRMREFYQADIDFAGDYMVMLPESELLTIIHNVFKELKLPEILIQVNHRAILDGTFMLCGVKEDDIRKVSSGIDKLDKLPWSGVRKELLEEKNIDAKVVDNLEKIYNRNFSGEDFVQFKKAILTAISNLNDEKGLTNINKGLRELEELDKILKTVAPDIKIMWNTSLARGLDYYTGLIYEVICPEHRDVGSISGGGRYDKLVGQFLKRDIACMGGSFGIDRIIAIMKRVQREDQSSANYVYVTMPTDNSTSKLYMLKIAAYLRKNGIAAEINMKNKFQLKQEIKYAIDNNIKYMVILGDDEEKTNAIMLKNIQEKTNKKMPIDDLVRLLR